MEKHIKFGISNEDRLQEKISEYFDQSGFNLVDKRDNVFKFVHGSSFFETWIFNPLKWKSEITVAIRKDELTANFSIDTSAQMNTFEEEAVWDTFIENFELFLTRNIDFKKTNQVAVKKSRRSGFAYVGWAISGAVIGGITGMLLSHLTGMDLFNYIGVPIGGGLLFANRIKHQKTKNVLY